MTVYSADDKKLGKVVDIDEGIMLVEKGLFFPKDYSIPLREVGDVRGDLIHLQVMASELTEPGWEARARERARAPAAARGEAREGTDIRVPVAEEELEATKRTTQAGAVRVAKRVVTEQKTLNVPVMHEEVTVERVPVERSTAEAAEASFKDETISVPVREEEVEVTKRPVVREEVRVRKQARIEEQRASGTVRREEVDIEREGDIEEEPARGIPPSEDTTPRR